jgi:hypothetical protein
MRPNAGGGGELPGLGQLVQLYSGAQMNFGDVTPYLTYMTNWIHLGLVFLIAVLDEAVGIRFPSHILLLQLHSSLHWK